MNVRSRQRRSLALFAPAALCAAIIIASILPLGLETVDTMLAPHFLLCVVYFWGVRAPARLPAIVIFGFSLLVDLLTAGPLGFWPLICMLTHGGALVASRFIRQRGYVVLCLGFVPVVALAEAAAWAVGCLYFEAWVDPEAALRATVVLCLAFPVLAIPFSRFAPPRAPVQGGL